MIEELAEPLDVDEDELADEDELPDEPTVGVDANGRRESAVITALRELGPATASEIGDLTKNDSANVSTRLRQLEQAGKVRRTGRSVNQGGRGGPRIEWELMPANGTPTGPDMPIATTGPVEERIRKLAESIAEGRGRIEQLENELEGARARADQADRRAAEAERRRQDAERRVGAAGVAKPEQLAAVERRAREAEEGHARLESELVEARGRVKTLEAEAKRAPVNAEGGGVPGDGMRERYFDLLLEQARADDAAEHVFDRIERLLGMTGAGE